MRRVNILAAIILFTKNQFFAHLADTKIVALKYKNGSTPI